MGIKAINEVIKALINIFMVTIYMCPDIIRYSGQGNDIPIQVY